MMPHVSQVALRGSDAVTDSLLSHGDPEKRVVSVLTFPCESSPMLT
ncbi:MAG: hypothetical protein ACK5PU_05155 [bacterium]|jgi:hypothetical protein